MNATVSETESDSPRSADRATLLPVVAWAIVLSGLTVGAAAWLTSTGGDYRDFSPAILVVAYSPAIAAIVVCCFEARPYGVRAFLGAFLQWRTRPLWYVVALIGPLVFALITAGALFASGTITPSTPLVLPAVSAIPVLLGPLIAGSLGEEPGWRGFAQKRLQTRWGALLTAVVVGVLWSVWHLWPMLTPVGRAELGPVDVAQTFLRLIATAVVYAWLYNASGRCLPVVLVAHAGHNLAVDLMPSSVIGSGAGAMTMAALYAAAAVAVVVATRGRLGSSSKAGVR
ncbi:CPBP family intramembrane metalloprotease [Planctomonas sp. JC2975]|uniref:CPBP family intramembrane glutamic endopeptidase n=1 Tax=Planctomonas sp. JC2975 TaxID=2729626 RepID=UPI001472B688|nr:CPBP family intramembrane glutamic endopeptidase [Planctomonas sp. JC2975]NNC11280.1 CPBP family intramembrane metalloprotease [Planctomonas sp. JC2975]